MLGNQCFIIHSGHERLKHPSANRWLVCYPCYWISQREAMYQSRDIPMISKRKDIPRQVFEPIWFMPQPGKALSTLYSKLSMIDGKVLTGWKCTSCGKRYEGTCKELNLRVY